MMSPTPKVGRDAVSVGASPGDDHAAVLLALPALDPGGAGVLAAEGGEAAVGVGAGEVGETAAGGAAVSLSGVVGHWIGGGKVPATLLLILLGGALLLLLDAEGTATATALWGVATRARGCRHGGQEQGQETDKELLHGRAKGTEPGPLL